MLPRVLLHVIAPPITVNQPLNPASLLQRRGSVEEMQDGSIVSLSNFSYTDLACITVVSRADPTCIENLATACRIKGSAIKDEGWTRIRHDV